MAFNNEVPRIILNTNLAGASACFASFVYCYFFQNKKNVIENIAGGTLTGLVAITACCNVVTPLASLLIGVIAGVIHNIGLVVMAEKWKLDDPVGAIPVHGFGGVFGTLCVALLGREELLVHDRWTQLGVQLVGVVSCFAFTCAVAFIMFKMLQLFLGLRLSPSMEKKGAFFAGVDMEMPDELPGSQVVSQVSVRVTETGYNLFSVTDYLSRPTEARLKLARENRVEYLDDEGNTIPESVALRQLSSIMQDQRDDAMVDKSKVMEEKEHIMQSISYASKIQGAILGQEGELKNYFPKSFIYFKPRDTVSGDFYWFAKVKWCKIIVVSDCTGHGVPGAFLTVLGVSILNEIIKQKTILAPERILEELDAKLVHALRNKGHQFTSHDGMDIGILVVDEKKSKAYYAGAKSNLYKLRDGGLEEIAGDKFSLGYVDERIQKVFTRKVVDYQQNDTFYLSSDGFRDQHNPEGKKYLRMNFKKLLMEVSNVKMEEQYAAIDKAFNEWKQDEEQTDDILVLGVKL